MGQQVKTFKLPSNKIIDPANEYFTNKAGIGWNRNGRDRIIELVKDKQNVIDVGAHVGITTVHWLMAGFKRVDCFEINPSHYECLLENTVEYKDQITYHPVGCSYETKTLEAAYRSPNNSGSFQMLDEHVAAAIPDKHKFLVDVVPLDNFKFESVSLIKIDVEGWEYEVLRGAMSTVREHQPILFVEYGHGDARKSMHKYDDSKFQEMLTELNYRELEVTGDAIFVPNSFVE